MVMISLRSAVLACAVLIPALVVTPAFAQTGTTLRGKVTRGETSLPMSGALVVIARADASERRP